MTMMGRYEAIRTIHQTAFGTVQLAVDHSKGGKVVLKISKKNALRTRAMLHNPPIEDPMAERAMYQHLSTLPVRGPEGVGSRHVLAALGHHDDSTFHILSLPFCDRGDLYDAIKKGLGGRADAESDQRRRLYFRQAAAGLSWLHRHGIAHRDLSPENIFLEDNDNCVIGDLGQALKLSEGQTRITGGSEAGKTPYRPPELIMGREHDAFASDIFSLGVTLFVLLSGLPPFKQASKEDKCWRYISHGKLAVLVKTWDLAEVIGPEALDLINNMLCKEEHRITIEQVLLHPFLQPQPGLGAAMSMEDSSVRAPPTAEDD